MTKHTIKYILKENVLDLTVYVPEQQKTLNGSSTSLRSLSSTNYLLTRRHSYPLAESSVSHGQSNAEDSLLDDGSLTKPGGSENEEQTWQTENPGDCFGPSLSMQPLLDVQGLQKSIYK